MTKKRILITAILAALLTGTVSPKSLAPDPQKPRTIVTTDGEVDDMDTFIRLLLYANEFNIEGIVYTSSQWHYAGDGKGTKFTSEMPMTQRLYGERTSLRWTGTEWIQQLIDRYAVSYPNLLKHDKGYPSPEYLKSIIHIGNIDFEGEMSMNTDGSDFIRKKLLDKEPGPVYVQLWGGTNTLARALKSIEEEYKGKSGWPALYRKVSEKTVIYAVLDQDATYRNYVAPNWPDIKVIYNSAQFWSFAYSWQQVVPDTLKPLLGGAWFKENIKFNHGPLLATYYCWGDGQKIPGDPDHIQGDTAEARKQHYPQYSFISEGDSPSYFFLLNYGLKSTVNPSFGGLGGRFVQSADNPNHWEDGDKVTDVDPYTGKEEASYPQIRWIETLQNDFAARADWCVKAPEEANHPPVVSLNHAENIITDPGAVIPLYGVASDPDHNALTFHWWQYTETGTGRENLIIHNAAKARTLVTIPPNAIKGTTYHLILEVTDNGKPSLTRYQRVIIGIE